jgi:hypothetical protein
MIQLGGLGIMTVATLLLLLVARRIGLHLQLTAVAETRAVGLAGVPQLTGDLVYIRPRLCWSAARGIGQQAKSPSNTTCR